MGHDLKELLPAVRDENGVAVEESELSEKPELVEFVVGKRKYAAFCLRSRVPAAPVLAYRAKESKLQKDSGLFDDMEELAHVQALAQQVRDLTDEEAKTALAREDVKLLQSYNLRTSLAQAQNEVEVFPFKAAICAQAIAAWNVPGIEPSTEALQNDAPLGESCVEAVWAWYFPFSADSAEEEETAPKTKGNTPASPRTTRPAGK